MAQVQISKIQLRRGPEGDLPGAPTSGNPTQPTTGLDVGEPAFTTDTGRVFIGSDPQQTGGPWYDRATFPYQNIEVLTENSTDALQNIFDVHHRDVRTAFFKATLLVCDPTNPADWKVLQVPSPDPANPTTTFLISTSSNIGSAEVEYFANDATTADPVKAGRLTVVFNGSATSVLVNDVATAYPRTDLTPSTGSSSPDALYGSLVFSATSSASPTGPQTTILYRNLYAGELTLSFRVTRPDS